jgi:hypothetical protein
MRCRHKVLTLLLDTRVGVTNTVDEGLQKLGLLHMWWHAEQGGVLCVFVADVTCFNSRGDSQLGFKLS